MTEHELRDAIRETLARIAPEADLDALPTDQDMREELDLDSMDFLNFVIALHERLGVDIPEADYPKLVTFEGALGYLQAALAKQG